MFLLPTKYTQGDVSDVYTYSFKHVLILFFQVYKKTKAKPNAVEKISQHLSDACCQVDAKLGLSPLKYVDLPHATRILRKNLLENPYLSNDFYLQLVGQFHAHPEKEESFKNQLHSLSKLKATLQILQLVQKRFENLPNNGEDKVESKIANPTTVGEDKAKEISITKGQITANAILLKKCLLNVITQGIYSMYVKHTNFILIGLSSQNNAEELKTLSKPIGSILLS